MIKEIGSIFPLSDAMLRDAEMRHESFTDDRVYYSLCREALYDIAMSLAGTTKKVLIPSYTCQTVITPFEEAGWQCAYYAVQRDLRIETNRLLRQIEEIQPSVLVVHPYYGMDLNETEQQTLDIIAQKGVKIVLDLTQCLFSTKSYSFASFIVASYRKWMPIPDGGYLIDQLKANHIHQPQNENSEFTNKEKDAMYLRGVYFETRVQRIKDISIRLSKAADHIVEDHIAPHRMSQVAYNLMQAVDLEANQQKRIENYAFLHKQVVDSSRVKKVCQDINEITTVPLYFPIYVKERQTIQRLLAENSIYAPVLWSVEDERVLVNEDVKYIYDHILVIPCDQRYDIKDMQRVVDVLNKN